MFILQWILNENNVNLWSKVLSVNDIHYRVAPAQCKTTIKCFVWLFHSCNHFSTSIDYSHDSTTRPRPHLLFMSLKPFRSSLSGKVGYIISCFCCRSDVVNFYNYLLLNFLLKLCALVDLLSTFALYCC